MSQNDLVRQQAPVVEDRHESLLDTLSNGNQFMSAGLGVMAVGAAFALFRSGVKRAAAFGKQQMLGKHEN